MVHFLSTHPITAVSVLIFLLALAKGGAPERWGAGVMVAEWTAELVVDNFFSAGDVAVAPTIILDAALAFALLSLALRYGRLWLGLAMILQSVMLALHAFALSDDSPGYLAYATALNLLTCAVVLNLLSATLSAWRKRARAQGATLGAAPQPSA